MQVSNVFVIGLCYGDEHVGGMLNVAQLFVGKNFPSAKKHQLLIVDNKLAGQYQAKRFGALYINGDNSQQEFSGWQRGVDYLAANFNLIEDDVIVFLNDTVHRRNYAVGGDRYFENYLIINDGSAPNVGAAGYLDDFPKEVCVNGLKFSTWIRSNLFAMNWATVKIVTPLAFPFPVNEIFDNTNPHRFWSEQALMSPNWIAYISSWLFGCEDQRFPEYRLKWLRHQKLSHENRQYFQNKAISILNEHYFTARLLNAGVKIFDFNVYPKTPDRHTLPYYN